MAQFMVHTWMSNHTLIHRPQDVKESGILSVTSQIPVTSSICGRSPQAFIRRVISSTSRLVRLLLLLLGRLTRHILSHEERRGRPGWSGRGGREGDAGAPG